MDTLRQNPSLDTRTLCTAKVEEISHDPKETPNGPWLSADRSCEYREYYSLSWKRGAVDSIWRRIGIGLPNEAQCIYGTTNGHPGRIRSSDHDAVTPGMAGLAIADGCLRATQTVSAHLELMYNGGPCELREQCKRPDAYLVGE